MVVVSTAAFHARVRGSFPGLGGLKETPHPLSIVGRLREGIVLGLRSLGSSKISFFISSRKVKNI